MEDEASILLDGKTLGNLRVVDLKQELEKRGLSKSGSKKDLVKRLKVQLEFEKLCGERKTAADCDLKLDLDADTEQNEFVQQYLAQQQKIYAEQKEAKRRIELEETLKGTEENENCDSTKGDDDDQTEPDEPDDDDSRSDTIQKEAGEETKTDISIRKAVEDITSQSTEKDIKTDVTNQNSKGNTKTDVTSQKADDNTKTVLASQKVEDEKSDVSNSKVEMTSLEVQDDLEISQTSDAAPAPAEKLVKDIATIKNGGDHENQVVSSSDEQVPVDPSVENTKYHDIINYVDQTTSPEVVQTERHDSSVENTKDHDIINYVDQIISPEVVQTERHDSSTENAERHTIVHEVEQPLPSEFIQDKHTEFCTEDTQRHNTIVHQGEQSLSSEFIQDKHAETCIEDTQEITHQDASSEIKETLIESRELISSKPEPLLEMEPATQFSTVPYSLMDIQLPESPGNVKPKISSDSVENDTGNSIEETQSNGIESSDIKSSEKETIEKTESNNDIPEKVGSPPNDLKHSSSSIENFEEHTQRPKKSNLDDSRSQLKKKESEHKSSKFRDYESDRKTRKTKDDLHVPQDPSSKSREKKRTRRSSEDSPSGRHSRSRSMEKARRLKEDSRSHRDSRSRSKERDRRTRKYEKDLDTGRVSRGYRDSRSRSKESDRKLRKSNVDSKSRKIMQSHRKSRSLSKDSKSAHSSDSDEEYRKRKDKSKETKQKRTDQRKSDAESDKSGSSNSDSSPSRNSKLKEYSAKQKARPYKRDSSGDNLSSRSRSPAKKKPVRRSDDPTTTDKHGRRKNRDIDQNSRSKSKESSPVPKKSSSKQVGKCDKENETTHRDDSSENDKVPQSPDHEDSSINKKSENQPNEFKVLPKDGSGKTRDKKRRNSEEEVSSLTNKSLEQIAEDDDLIKSSWSKNSKNTDNSERSRSREKSPSQNKLKCTSESLTDTSKTVISQEKGKSCRSRSKSQERSPVKHKSEEQASDSAIPHKKKSQHKQPESGNSDDGQTSRSRSRESTPDHVTKGSIDESSVDPTASTKCSRQESQGSVDSRDSRSREKSPDFKRSKICSEEASIDSSSASEIQMKPTKTVIPGAVKKGNITIVKKEPVKQKLKIKRDNVVISSQNKKEEKENKSEELEIAESTEENQKEPTGAPVRTQYVSRKITLSNRSQSVASDDEPKNKRSKWGNLAPSQKISRTINISTDSLKNWFPDFKLLKDPTPEELASLTKEESDMEIGVNKMEKDSRQASNPKKFQEPQQEMQMEVDQEETGPVSKVLFIQNLVRPFTLNQLKELLRETGKFIEEDFWIDKIKSKCFVTYETEEEAIRTRNRLNGTRWPSSNPKILSVEFSNGEELTLHRSGNEAPKTVLQPVLEPNDDQESHSMDEFRKKEHDHDRKRDRSKPPVREWDKDKVAQGSPNKERTGKDADKSKHLDKKDKKDSKRRTNNDTPAKLLDDLFQKTKSSPCIYWLPLTDEQVHERMESRRLRRLEREKRNQQREQEDAENKNKRPRSRNRTRDAEPRRSLSRSPVTRRR